MKVLIIEDEKILSQNIMLYLTDNNYICEQAFSFDDALAKFLNYEYDCILLDLNLPGGDGMKLLEHIKKNKINSGIIIISARNSIDDKISGISLGADDYMAKPFSLAELCIRIFAVIRRRKFTGR